jgi:hypothetical protein
MELDFTVMAGSVLSLFLLAGEFALLRRPAFRLFAAMRAARLAGHQGRFLLMAAGLAVFIFVQPLLVAAAVLWLLTDLHPQFAAHAWRDLRQVLAPLLGRL